MNPIMALLLATHSLLLTASNDTFSINQDLSHTATLPRYDCQCSIRQGKLEVSTISSNQPVPIWVQNDSSIQQHDTVYLPQNYLKFLGVQYCSHTFPNIPEQTICCFNFNEPGFHDPTLFAALLLQKDARSATTTVELLSHHSQVPTNITRHLQKLGIQLPHNPNQQPR